uniref:Uncharacterized protein n=1 Tax=Bionectria ochroleuca TaxID=29856 RepID=A0A8H7K5I2_BIOOC
MAPFNQQEVASERRRQLLPPLLFLSENLGEVPVDLDLDILLADKDADGFRDWDSYIFIESPHHGA